LAVDGSLHRPQIVEWDVLEAARKRLEAVMVLLLGRRGDSGQGPAVESTAHRDDVAAVARSVLLGPLPGQLDRRLVGLGSGVREEHPVGERVVAEQLGQVRLRRNVKEVRDVEQRRRLLPHRTHDFGMAMAQRGHRDAPREVEILLPFGVPDANPFPANEGERITLRGGHEVTVRPFDQLFGLHVSSFPGPGSRGPREPRWPSEARQRMISVPMPSLVKTSSRIACATRPSMMCAFCAPPASARREDSTFGSMPPSMTPALIKRSASRFVSVETSWPSSPAIPATSVRWMSFSATRAAATSPATRSALMLYVSPPIPTPTGAITGMNACSSSSRMGSGSTFSTSPTRPMSTAAPAASRCSRFLARIRLPSLPESPTARPP